MLVYIHGAKCMGIDAVPVTVEVNITLGVGIHLVGLADAAVKESLLRTVTALQAKGFHIPGKKIVINLAPADLHKQGSGYDLPIALGIIVGSIPIPVGMKAPIKLGLAGGPLVVAIIGSWLGVKKNWFTTEFTESHGVWMLREVGIALFLAGVGLGAGGQFVETVQEHYIWVVYGVIITMIPPIVVGLFGRLVLKVNYYTLMGFIGGSHTDPPTLAFANTVAPEGCKLPNMGYATVYPLTMFLRIFTAQLLVLMAV